MLMLESLGLRKEVCILADLAALQETIGISFKDLSLLERALLHSSYVNETTGSALDSNERLEFLGDAILGFVVAEKLYQDFPDLTEGEMTKLRSVLVCRDTLARVARSIGLGECLYLGRGEGASGGRHKAANLACVFEALVAAIFFDQGVASTRDFVLRLLDEELQKAITRGLELDYKSRLQELIQSRQQLTPTYHLVEAVGPDHDKQFTVEVIVGDAVLGSGSGKSKKSAETEAARSALERLSAGFTE